MESNEVKPSFSLKYLFLTALTAAIVGAVGFGLSKLYESRPNQELTVTNGYSIDVIGGTSLPNDKFEVEYYIKGKERKRISSLFRKKVILKNTGNSGISDLNVTAILKNEDVSLIDSPKIESSPENIVDAINLTKGQNSSTRKHYWNISLLNPGESISFDYSAFSEKSLDSISLDVIPRKKDLKIQYEEFAVSKEFSLSRVVVIMASGLVLIVLVPYGIAFPFYRYQWGRRPDFRENYSSFIEFFNNHRPWDLFKSKDESANKQSKADA